MSSLLISEPPLQVLPSLAVKIGLNEAIVIQQLHYWLQRSSVVDDDLTRWVFNTIEEWRTQFPFWSVDTVKRTLKSLREQGVVRAECLSNDRMNKTLFYTIDYAKLGADGGGAAARSGESAQCIRAKCTNGENQRVTDDDEAKSLISPISANCPNASGQNAPMFKRKTETTKTENTKKKDKYNARARARVSGGVETECLFVDSIGEARMDSCGTEVDEDFETFWAQRPRRDGSDPKRQAQKAWNARLREGITADEMIGGMMAYAQHCDRKRITGSSYVMQARTFLGPDLHFKSDWRKPNGPANFFAQDDDEPF